MQQRLALATVTMANQPCIHARVSGKVQGVYYRANTQKKAARLNLTGWVRNCENGDVELVACGEQTNIDKLVKWLWKGPLLARVKNVDVSDAENPNCHEFEVRY